MKRPEFRLSRAPQNGNNDEMLSRVFTRSSLGAYATLPAKRRFYHHLDRHESRKPAMGERGNIMQIGSIVRSVHIAVPQGEFDLKLVLDKQ